MMEVYNVIDGDSLNVVLQKEDIYFNDSWVFWFRQHRAPGNKITNYEEGIKRISTFSSVSGLNLSVSAPPRFPT